MRLFIVTLIFVSISSAARAAVWTTNTPDKDAFVRASATNNNYGGGGALSVSGSSPTTGNPTNGAFDSFISYNTLGMVTNFNATLGTNNWIITSATLNLTQNPSPGNSVFNSGTGNFQIRWIANDTWTEGTGTPNAPTSNGVTYAQETNYLNTNTDMNLGTFDFTGSSVTSCPLALPASFVTNMEAVGEMGLFLTAVDPSIGFVFYSRQFAGLASTHPLLVVSAVAQPVVSAVSVVGTNLVLSATNGMAGGTYEVLTSTNLALPLTQWTSVATNALAAGSGYVITNFTVTLTNAASLTAPSPQFFILQTQ